MFFFETEKNQDEETEEWLKHYGKDVVGKRVNESICFYYACICFMILHIIFHTEEIELSKTQTECAHFFYRSRDDIP